MALEDWQRRILEEARRSDLMLLSDDPPENWVDYMCWEDARERYSRSELERRARWTERMIREDRGIPLAQIK